MVAQKEINQLLREARAAGMTCERVSDGNNHYRVTNPADGRWFTVGCTPGSKAAIRKGHTRLRRLIKGLPSSDIRGGGNVIQQPA